MTEHEKKAKELVDKHKMFAESDSSMCKVETGTSIRKTITINGKQSALITVEEVIIALEQLLINDPDSGYIVFCQVYWEKVKQAIEKI